MLAPDSRAVLLDELRPPVGYVLDAAVATTFTLDLAAALVPPLAFASFELRGTPDPVAALEAVRSCTDRVDVFCQAGQITVPSRPSDLMTYLEKMVHVVRRPRPGHLFHPKIWVLRYRSGTDDARYRLLCLTRNLTSDHSWDAVVRLDGVQSGGPKAANRPLFELLKALPALAVRQPLPENRKHRIAGLAEDIRRVEWELPPDIQEVAFHVFGLSGAQPAPDFHGYRHLVVAPFLSDAGLDVVAPPGSIDVTVISRAVDLDRLSTDTILGVAPYVLSAVAGLDDAAAEGLQDQQILSDLHAKMYLVERDRRAHLFVGSANATEAAFGGNVEILVELVGGATKVGVETFLGPDAPFRALIEEYDADGGMAPDPLEDARRRLQDLVRDLAAILYTITVKPSKTGGFTLTARTETPVRIPDGYECTFELLTMPGDVQHFADGHRVQAAFSGVPLADVTPFLVLQVTSPEGLKMGSVIRAGLVNDPPGRLDEVLARQVDTPEKFLRFLALLLGFDNPHLLGLLAGSGVDGAGIGAFGTAPGIFELVLRALADHPDAVANLDSLVQRLQATTQGRAVLPSGFDTLWPVVIAAHARLPKAVRR